MSVQRQVDVLIIGAGLAGAILAWYLRQAGMTIHLADDRDANSASRVAAGLINPITGRRLVKSWNIERFYPEAMRLYDELAQFFSRPFFIPCELIHVFQTEQQYQDWLRRGESVDYQGWSGRYLASGTSPYPLHDPFGSYLQDKSGYLVIPELLQCLTQLLAQEHSISNQSFAYDQLGIDSNGVQWQGIQAKTIVFCEGYKALNNPWFAGVGLNPVKGEILTVTSKGSDAVNGTSDNMPTGMSLQNQPLTRHIINKGQWILPLDDIRYRIGATYSRDLELNTSTDALEQLLGAMRHIFSLPLDMHVEAQQAGIRPASVDRKPLLGSHPDLPQLKLFNGFGSKGSLQIPYCANVMCQFLKGEQPIPADMDVARFFDAAGPKV